MRFEATANGDVAWDFDGDGFPDAHGKSVLWSCDTPGERSVGMTIKKAGRTETVERRIFVSVVSPESNDPQVAAVQP